MKKHFLQCIALFISLFLCKVDCQSIPKSLHASQLANGLQIFFNEVPSSAMIRVDFLCRAGYSAQDNVNAGFLELYSRLFLSTAKSDSVMNYVPVSYKSNADRVIYSCDVTEELFDSYIKSLSKCIAKPSFSENDIKDNYNIMKNRISAYQNSDAGFINSAIESKVVSDSPWKQSFGINNSTFSSYSFEQIKSMLLSVQKNYYTPDNCAIFISGNISSNSISKTIKKYLSSWHGSYTGSHYKQKDNSIKDYNAQKKFVLTSPDFSTDITQIAVQFTELSKNETQILNEIFNAKDSPLKDTLTKEPALAIRAKEYLSSSCSNESIGARLILQSIMEPPYSIARVKDSPKISQADQAELFVQLVKRACNAEEEKYSQAKNSLYSKFLFQSGANQKLLDLMEDFWTTNPYINSSDLYNELMKDGKNIQSISKDSIMNHIINEQPYVFVMLNDSTYLKDKDSFAKNGFSLITKNDDAWYKNNSYSISDNITTKNIDSEENLFNDSSYSKYYVDNIRTISSSKLGNEIPITTKTIKDSQTILTSIAIDGGESQSPVNHKKLRTLLVNASAERMNAEISKLTNSGNITGDVKILSWTTETNSYITLECQKNEFHEVLSAAINALIYAELDPLTIDLLIGDQKYQWRRQISDLSFQLKCKAMEYLYKDTVFESVYNISQDTDILLNTSFQTVLLSYTKLLDASLYSIVFTGDIDIKTAKNEAEQSFGMLKKQKERSNLVIPAPKTENKVLNVQLQHTFSSNLSATNAPKDAPNLVTTKKFYDPMQFYFASSSIASQRELFNAVLFELANLIKEDLGEGYNCIAEGANGIIQVGKLEAPGLLHKSSFISSYKNARKKLLSELNDQEKSDLRLATIRNTWSYKTLLNTQNNEGTAKLIQDSLVSGAPHAYLESFLFVSNAKGSDFTSILEKYFPENPSLQVFSIDSKE